MNWTKQEDSKGVLTVVLEGPEWEKAVQKTFAAAKSNLSAKGFRKGAVPEKLAKKMISMDAVYDQAAQSLAQKAYEEGLKEFNLDPVTRPVLTVKDATDKSATLEFAMVVSPEATLGDWKAIKVAKEAVEVTEEEVENEVKNLQDHYADWVLKEEDEPAENGDRVTIDFIGTKDGVPFEGGASQGYPLVLGSGSFIPGFEEQLIGIKPEEKREIEVTFPENYPAEELAGQPVKFEVTAHDIQKKEVPEFNDELVARLKRDGIETAEKYREEAKKALEAQKEKAAGEKQDNEIVDELLKVTEVNIPEEMVDAETNQMLQRMEQQVKQAGFTLDQYLAAMNQNKDDLKAQFVPEAEKNIKTQLALEAVADAAGLEVADEELEDEYKTLSELYNMPVERIKMLIDPSQIIFSKKQEKAMDLLRKQA